MSRSLITANIAFGEGPRWRDGRVWLSDIFAKRVLAVDLDGRVEVVATVDQHPSGLGWLPDGRLLVVSMLDRRVLRLEPGGLVEHADLSAVCPGNCNDMVVDGRGNAYVGNTGYSYAYRGEHVPIRRATHLVLVRPDGSTEAQPGMLMFPNGCAVTADNATLVVAQSHGGRLTAYSIADDGALYGERLFAALPGESDHPDGICLDAEGAVWMAAPAQQRCVRVLEGGQITHIIDTAPWECIACVLGGNDGHNLFLLLSPSRHDKTAPSFVLGSPAAVDRCSRLEAIEVDVPGAGWP